MKKKKLYTPPAQEHPQVKQYYSWPAYTDNYHVMTVIDGKIEDDSIVSLYALSEIMEYLEGRGYKKACLLQEAEIELKKAEEALKDAKEAMERAQANPLQISEEEIKGHHMLSLYLKKLKGECY